MANQRKRQPDGEGGMALTGAALVEQIERRLDGRLSDDQLAAWAFAQFYAIELGELNVAPESEPALVEALDALMFGDVPEFRLNEEELRALAARLAEL